MITRRHLLATGISAGIAGTIRHPAFAADPKTGGTLPPAPMPIVAKPGATKLLGPGGRTTGIWGYGGSVPGPEIRTPQGKEFAARLENNLPLPTTIHWHGIRIDNAMDGVTGLTQPAVAPGETFDYRFTPPDAGTYWYHPHNRTWEQLARGLYGAFIVEEEKPPAVDQDRVLIIDDWRLDENDAIDERSMGSMHDVTHAGRLGNVLTLNGKDKDDIPVRAGERLRLRLINASNARIMGVVFEGHAPVVVALDGFPANTPFVPKRNMVILAPAQRADVILDCDGEVGAKANIVIDVGRERLPLGQLVYDGAKRARAQPLSDLPILPANPMPTDLDLANAVPIELVMEGGAMGRMRSAAFKGRKMGIRELVGQHGKAWAFNGIAGFPDKPLAAFALGQTVTVRMVNRTAWPHAMHFHGHHVREIAHSNRPADGNWRDTIFMERDDEITVAFKAHNPGLWMLHCHMLGHQRGGMSTWYEVG
jgi:FtsP/CotA-like multicopper oxidase with cupredoxin domain